MAPLGRAGATELGSGGSSVPLLLERKKYPAAPERPLETEKYEALTWLTKFMALV